jgi:hypothetical protein
MTYRTRSVLRALRSLHPIAYDEWMNGYSENFLTYSRYLQTLPNTDARILLFFYYQVMVDRYLPFFEECHTTIAHLTIQKLNSA